MRRTTLVLHVRSKIPPPGPQLTGLSVVLVVLIVLLVLV